MATDNHTHFNAADIERYHKGLLSAKERHALEKAALDDPFLADALEGYAVAGVNAGADLDELKNRLSTRVEGAAVVPIQPERRRFSPAIRVAAMIVVLVGAGLLVYQFGFNNKNEEVADNRTVNMEEKKPDTARNTASVPATTFTNPAETGPSKQPDNTGTVTATGKGEIKTVSPAPGKVSSDILLPPRSEESKDVKTTDPVAVAPATTRGLDDETVSDKVMQREDSKTRSLAKKSDKDAVKEGGGKPADAKDERAIAGNQPLPYEDVYRNKANTFRGRVTDANNTGLPFANVTNTQDNVGTYTDANGNFTLTSTDSVLHVQIRSLGYDNAQTQLRNNVASNKVVMQEDRRNLSEVVVSTQKPNAAARSKDDTRKLIEPEPIDGWVKYDSYLANNLNVPDDFEQQKASTINSVQVSFEVDKNGEPVNIRIEKSLCSACDKEAIRLIKEGPKWKRNAGKKGRTTVTINF